MTTTHAENLKTFREYVEQLDVTHVRREWLLYWLKDIEFISSKELILNPAFMYAKGKLINDPEPPIV